MTLELSKSRSTIKELTSRSEAFQSQLEDRREEAKQLSEKIASGMVERRCKVDQHRRLSVSIPVRSNPGYSIQ
jgi:ribosomal protein L9